MVADAWKCVSPSTIVNYWKKANIIEDFNINTCSDLGDIEAQETKELSIMIKKITPENPLDTNEYLSIENITELSEESVVDIADRIFFNHFAFISTDQ